MIKQREYIHLSLYEIDDTFETCIDKKEFEKKLIEFKRLLNDVNLSDYKDKLLAEQMMKIGYIMAYMKEV